MRAEERTRTVSFSAGPKATPGPASNSPEFLNDVSSLKSS